MSLLFHMQGHFEARWMWDEAGLNSYWFASAQL